MKTHIVLVTFVASAFVATAADGPESKPPGKALNQALYDSKSGELLAGFTSLFNGKDLTGWRGNPDLWSVEDGTIKGITKADPKLAHNTFLVWTNGEVGDFELRLSYKIVNGNSGIQYRSKVVREGVMGPVVQGYQADFEAGTTYSGILYEEGGRGILAQRGQKVLISADEADAKKHKIKTGAPVGDTKEIQSKIKKEDWNDYVIIANGNLLKHFINGTPTVEVVDNHEAKAAKSGVLALQIHTGPPMTVQFKNIRIKKLGGAAAADTLKKMAGKWVPVEATLNGAAVERSRLDAVLMTIEGNKYTTKTGDRTDEGTLTLDEAKSPITLDITRTRSNGETATIPAICEVSGDTMRICYGFGVPTRPSEFKSEADAGALLVTYKRE